MEIVELVLLSIGLAMDAFAVSICKGISMKKMSFKKASIIGLWFETFGNNFILVKVVDFIYNAC